MVCNLLFRPPRVGLLVAAMIGWLGVSSTVEAEPVLLQQPTATFSQAGFFSISRAIDTTPDPGYLGTGWAVCHCIQSDPNYGKIVAETAVFETVTDVGFAGPGTIFTFTLDTNYGPDNDGPYILGRFRLSVTTDDRSEFADGLDGRFFASTGEQIPGDVSANWTVLNPFSAVATEGVTLTELPDNSLLAGNFEDLPAGPPYIWPKYTVTAHTTLQNITGIRLEAMEDESLPAGGDEVGGPGTHSEGNFVLTNFLIDAVEGAAPAGVDGDYNDDGVVDAADYTVWRDNFGGTSLQNEGGISLGTVDQADYDFWKSRFGATSGGGNGSGVGAVPEPTSVALTLLAGLVLAAAGGRRCRE